MVEFDGIVNSNLPWEFEPSTRQLEVHPGEVASVSYYVTNIADKEVTGQAIPSVIPWFGNQYFKKMACFCFMLFYTSSFFLRNKVNPEEGNTSIFSL